MRRTILFALLASACVVRADVLPETSFVCEVSDTSTDNRFDWNLLRGEGRYLKATYQQYGTNMVFTGSEVANLYLKASNSTNRYYLTGTVSTTGTARVTWPTTNAVPVAIYDAEFGVTDGTSVNLAARGKLRVTDGTGSTTPTLPPWYQVSTVEFDPIGVHSITDGGTTGTTGTVTRSGTNVIITFPAPAGAAVNSVSASTGIVDIGTATDPVLALNSATVASLAKADSALQTESDPVWSAVSNTVTTGAAAGATALQAEADTLADVLGRGASANDTTITDLLGLEYTAWVLRESYSIEDNTFVFELSDNTVTFAARQTTHPSGASFRMSHPLYVADVLIPDSSTVTQIVQTATQNLATVAQVTSIVNAASSIPYAIPYAASVTVDPANGWKQYLDCTNDCTITFASGSAASDSLLMVTLMARESSLTLGTNNVYGTNHTPMVWVTPATNQPFVMSLHSPMFTTNWTATSYNGSLP